MALKPWRNIAVPHKDVLSGTFKQAEFAADLSLVHDDPDNAPPEYSDPAKFFARTFITEGMGLLLDNVIRRLSGGNGDPVIQLQTAFGGGKTHTLLAVYHLARQRIPLSDMQGIPTILDKADVSELSPARAVVLDGNKLAAGQTKQRGSITIHTLWGELAWQLGGEAAYAQVEASDKNGTSPGKEILANLFRQYAPCAILIDEAVAYLRQFEEGKQYPGGTFDSNLSFIQALTEAVSAAPQVVLLASLPESRREAGGAMGVNALSSLEHYFRRLQAIWKPVAAEEEFEIVRCRLFENIQDSLAKEEVCRAFADYYLQHKDDFPLSTQESSYYRRLLNAYPIHPEIFDRLYEDWSTLPGFQRTRGVLKLLAQVIHRLWESDNKDLLIMPSSLPLYHTPVRNEALGHLPQGWEPVIDKEIDGEHSLTVDIERESRFGALQAARRTARTIFLGSAPNVEQQRIRGIEVERIVLGSAQPGQSSGVYKDALRRMNDSFSYLYFDNNRYWFDTRPNLRREMEDRKRRFDIKEDVLPELHKRLKKIFAPGPFAGIHIFNESADIPDDWGLRLVVLPLGAAYSKAHPTPCHEQASAILSKRGEQPRVKQNRLLFLAPDAGSADRMREQVCIYLAWNSIVEDVRSKCPNLDIHQQSQAEQNRDIAQNVLSRIIREVYRWLLSPMQKQRPGKGLSAIEWEAFKLSPDAPGLMKEIERVMKEEELLISEWSPMFMADMLRQWFWKEGEPEAKALDVWQKTCCYVYLPRLLHDGVFKQALSNGLQSRDYFAYADGKEGDKYLGFVFGKPVNPLLEASLIIEKTVAEAYQVKLDSEYTNVDNQQKKPTGGVATGKPPSYAAGQGKTPTNPTISSKKRFYGTVSLDLSKARMEFGTIIDEVLQQFTAKHGVNVIISVEITAEANEGFDESTQRTVRENCHQLKFTSSEFEDV